MRSRVPLRNRRDNLARDRTLDQFVAGKPVPNFKCGGVFGVGAVDGVFLQLAGEFPADGSLFGVGGVGCSHQLAQIENCVFLFQDHEEERA